MQRIAQFMKVSPDRFAADWGFDAPNPYDELKFGLTKTPQLVLLAFKRNEEKDWITVTDPSQVRKLIIADQT